MRGFSNNKTLFSTMTFALIIRTSGRAAAFSSPPAGRPSSRLQVGFLENLQKSFSTMANDSSNNSSKSKYFTVGLTGSGGLIGTAFRDEVSKKGTINGKPVRIVCLTRGAQAEEIELADAAGETKLVWNPNADTPESVVDVKALQSMDAIIHLAGENISTGQGILGPLGIRPWTDEKKAEIINSRVVTTSALAKAIGASKKKTDFLVASGVGAYGPNFIGKDVTAADENTDISKAGGFLAEVSRQWEDASLAAKKNGNCRVVNLRNGVVLSTKGGAMAKLYPIFFLGGGGIVGSGDQYFPFISARDMARAMLHVLESKSKQLEGPVNMCAPVSATNADFTYAMGSVLKRPTILPLPSFAVSLLFGEMGEEVLLGGTRATPSKLLDSGFQFSHPTVQEAVQSAVDENI